MSRRALGGLAAAFVALVLLGLVLSRLDFRALFAREEAKRPGAPAETPEMPAPRPDAPRAQAAPPIVRQEDAGAPQSSEPSPSPTVPASPRPPNDDAPGTIREADVQAALAAVGPLVRECFDDVRDRYPPPQKVELRFQLVADGERGRLQRGEIVSSTIDDPWVHACLLDSVLDARFPTPGSRGRLTLSHSFSSAERR